MMARTIRIHLSVPAESAPAPHMTGGVVQTNEPRLGPIGTGKPHVMACDPTIKQSEWDQASGEWWAVACRACGATEIYKQKKATEPDPRAGNVGGAQVESMEGCC